MESTQKYIPISEIKRDCLVLNDGSLRAVILVSSINFGLKSTEEQKAIIQGYVQFLNSLEYPIQIVIQSRKLNIQDHIEDLKKRMRSQTNELLKSQMADYIDFLQELIELGEIMTKRFYIVVPYNPAGEKRKNILARISEVLSAGVWIKLKRERFERYREALFRRVDNIINALASMGLKAVPLDTQSLIELFYNSYNPTISEREKLVELNKLKVEE